MKILQTSKNNWGHPVKLIACIAAFIAAMTFFSIMCARLVNNYFITVDWFVNFGISALLIFIMLGVTAVLVRPFWLALATYFSGAVIYAVFTGMGIVSWIAAAVCFALLFFYLLFESGQLKNQIKFSTHPLGDKNMLLCSLFAALVAVSLSFGYSADSLKRAYIFPPQIKSAVMDQATAQFKSAIEKQSPKASEKQKQSALKTSLENVRKMMDDVEKNAQPYKNYISIFIGLFAFIIFQIVLFLIAFVAQILLKFVFWLFNVTHYTNSIVEKIEVKRLTL